MESIKEMAAALAAYEAENNNKTLIEGNAAILQAFNDLKALMFHFASLFCAARSGRAAVENAYTFAEVANETESSAAAVAVTVTVTEDDDDDDVDSNNTPREIAKKQIIEAYHAFTQQLTVTSFPEPAKAWPIITSSILVREVSQFASRHVNTSSSGTNVLSWDAMTVSATAVYRNKEALIEVLKLADASVSPVPIRDSMNSIVSDVDSFAPVVSNGLNVCHNTNIPSRLDIIAQACQTNTEMVQEILADHIGGTTVASAEVVQSELEDNGNNGNSIIHINATPPSVELKFIMTDTTVVNTYSSTYSGATTVTAAQGSKSIEQIAADMAEAYYQSKWLEHPEKTKNQFDAFIKTLPAEPVSSRNAQLQGLLLAALKAKGFESFYAAVPMRIPYSTSSSYNSGSNGLQHHGYSSNMRSYQPPTQVYTSAHSSGHVPVPLSLTGTGNNGSLNFSSLVTLQSVTVTA